MAAVKVRAVYKPLGSVSGATKATIDVKHMAKSDD